MQAPPAGGVIQGRHIGGWVPMQDFEGRVAVVTGAASGIGLGLCRRLAARGMKIAMCDIRPEPLQAAAAALGLGDAAETFVTDVSDAASVAETARAVEARFGRVDVLCNNAGVLVRGRAVEDISLQDWDWIVGVNLYGVIHGVRSFLPLIRRHGQGGHIVNTASISGFLVTDGRQTGSYQATKFAVVALSESLRSDLKDTGIGVSVLAPAGVRTGIYESTGTRPARFAGSAEDFPTPESVTDGMEPDVVADKVIAAIERNDLYIFTHPEARAWVEARNRRIMDAFDAQTGVPA